jgi:exopolysaccharide biosynthesis polyprenyl glycosylphosphotransferase
MAADAAIRSPGRLPAPERAFRRRFIRSRFAGVRRVPAVRDIREGERTAAALRRDTRVRRALACADLAAASIALAAAFLIGDHRPTLLALAIPLMVVPFGKLARLYERDEHVIRKSTLDQAPALFQLATLYALITWLTSPSFVTDGLGRSDVAVMWGLTLLVLVPFRVAARRLAARVTAPERILVLGGTEPFQRLEERIDHAHSLRIVLVGRVALERDDRGAPVPLGPLDDLDYVLRVNEVERVVIAPSERTSDEQLDTIRVVKALGVKVSVLPRLFEVVGSSLEFDDVDGLTVLGLRRYGLSKTSWYVKRAFDLTVTSLGLIAIVPLWATIAIIVKLSSPGPVLFRQPRVGRGGTIFQMLKFRTMYDGADEGKAELRDRADERRLFKLADDPRVTPAGRFLRRTSLDELPQLLNVLRGEMSLVGPRPLVEEEDRKIRGLNHRRREGTPGMTGVWQVLGSARVPLDDMVTMDYLYRANWSLWLDVKILLRTVAHVFGRRGL